MVLNVDPNDSPDARPIVEACIKAGAYVTTQWNKPADLHPWIITQTTSRILPSMAFSTARTPGML